MATRDLGEIQEVYVREVWPNEPQNFTTWLAQPDGLVLLGSALGLDLELVQPEASVGDFRLDILARETNDRELVAIENQLEMTDHDHLGKSITYAAENRVGYVIWIASEFRPEHKKAIDWLNSLAPKRVWFFAVEIHAIQIDDSKPAAEFRPVAVPREWEGGNARYVIPSRPDSSEDEKYLDFFQSLVDELNRVGFTDKTESESGVYGRQRYEVFFSEVETEVRVEEISYNAIFENDRARICFYFFAHRGNSNLPQRIYDNLWEERDEIGHDIGQELHWDKRRNHNFFYVSLWRDAKIDDPPVVLDGLRTWMVDMLPKLKNVFDPRIEKILAEMEEE